MSTSLPPSSSGSGGNPFAGGSLAPAPSTAGPQGQKTTVSDKEVQQMLANPRLQGLQLLYGRWLEYKSLKDNHRQKKREIRKFISIRGITKRASDTEPRYTRNFSGHSDALIKLLNERKSILERILIGIYNDDAQTQLKTDRRQNVSLNFINDMRNRRWLARALDIDVKWHRSKFWGTLQGIFLDFYPDNRKALYKRGKVTASEATKLAEGMRNYLIKIDEYIKYLEHIKFVKTDYKRVSNLLKNSKKDLEKTKKIVEKFEADKKRLIESDEAQVQTLMDRKQALLDRKKLLVRNLWAKINPLLSAETNLEQREESADEAADEFNEIYSRDTVSAEESSDQAVSQAEGTISPQRGELETILRELAEIDRQLSEKQTEIGELITVLSHVTIHYDQCKEYRRSLEKIQDEMAKYRTLSKYLGYLDSHYQNLLPIGQSLCGKDQLGTGEIYLSLGVYAGIQLGGSLASFLRLSVKVGLHMVYSGRLSMDNDRRLIWDHSFHVFFDVDAEASVKLQKGLEELGIKNMPQIPGSDKVLQVPENLIEAQAKVKCSLFYKHSVDIYADHHQWAARMSSRIAKKTAFFRWKFNTKGMSKEDYTRNAATILAQIKEAQFAKLQALGRQDILSQDAVSMDKTRAQINDWAHEPYVHIDQKQMHRYSLEGKISLLGKYDKEGSHQTEDTKVLYFKSARPNQGMEDISDSNLAKSAQCQVTKGCDEAVDCADLKSKIEVNKLNIERHIFPDRNGEFLSIKAHRQMGVEVSLGESASFSINSSLNVGPNLPDPDLLRASLKICNNEKPDDTNAETPKKLETDILKECFPEEQTSGSASQASSKPKLKKLNNEKLYNYMAAILGKNKFEKDKELGDFNFSLNDPVTGEIGLIKRGDYWLIQFYRYQGRLKMTASAQFDVPIVPLVSAYFGFDINFKLERSEFEILSPETMSYLKGVYIGYKTPQNRPMDKWRAYFSSHRAEVHDFYPKIANPDSHIHQELKDDSYRAGSGGPSGLAAKAKELTKACYNLYKPNSASITQKKISWFGGNLNLIKFPLKDNLHYLSETSVWDQQTWSRESDLRISRFQKRSNLTKTIDVALDAYHREIKTKSTGPKKRGGINFLSLDPLTTAKLDENFSNYNDEELPLKLSEIMIKRMFPLDQLLAKVDNWIYVTTETKEKNRGKVSKRLENVLKLKKIIDNEKKGLDYISNAIDEEIKKRKKAKEESQLSFLDQKIQEYLEAYKKAVDIKLGAVQPAPPELPPRPEPVLDMANIAFLGSTNILSKKDWVSLSSRGISFMQRRSLYTKNIDAAVDQFHSVDLKNINESLEKAPSLNREKVLFYRQLIDRQITAVNKVFEKVDFWITYSKKSSKRSGKRSRRLKNIEEFMSNVMAEKNALDSHKKTFEKSLN